MVIAGRAERLQASDLSLNIVGLQVEVHPFLGDLLVVGPLEQYANLGVWKPQQSVDGAAPLREWLLGGGSGSRTATGGLGGTTNHRSMSRSKERMTDKLLTMEEAAERLNITPRHVRRLVFERRIAYRKVGRFVRFHPDDLAEYVAAHRVEVVRPAAGRLRAVGGRR
jgi:excisionase family DNA binding protein